MQVTTPIPALVFLIASGCSAYLCTRLLRIPMGGVRWLLAVLVLWEAIQIVPVQLLAGLQIAHLVPQLTMRMLAGMQIVILAGVWIWVKKQRTPAATTPPGSQPTARLPAYILVSMVVLAGSYGLFALDVFTSFPSGSDALIYHLPLALRWLQDGSLSLPASRVWPLSLPGNAEIIMMVLLSSGVQSGIVVVNLIAAMMLALSAYLLAMWTSNGNKVASVTVCVIVMSVPMIEFQTFSGYVDLFGTASLCAAFALVLGDGVVPVTKSYAVLESPLIFIAGLACGIALGAKLTLFLYVLIWAGFLFFVLWQGRSGRTKAVLRSTLLVCLGLLLPSSFWFARAAVQTGNPVYPVQVRIGRHIIFRGIEPSQIAGFNFAENAVGGNFEQNFVYRVCVRSVGLCCRRTASEQPPRISSFAVGFSDGDLCRLQLGSTSRSRRQSSDSRVVEGTNLQLSKIDRRASAWQPGAKRGRSAGKNLSSCRKGAHEPRDRGL